MVTELVDVGDGFECLNGGSPVGTKKPADPGWKGEHEGESGGSVRGGQGGSCVVVGGMVRCALTRSPESLDQYKSTSMDCFISSR